MANFDARKNTNAANPNKLGKTFTIIFTENPLGNYCIRLICDAYPANRTFVERINDYLFRWAGTIYILVQKCAKQTGMLSVFA